MASGRRERDLLPWRPGWQLSCQPITLAGWQNPQPRAIDSFTVSLHSPNGGHLPALRAVQGDCQWPRRIMGIPIGHVGLQIIMIEAIPVNI